LHLPTKTFKAARKASHLAQSLGAQAVKEKHDLVQQGLNTDGDIFGILREDRLFNWAGLIMFIVGERFNQWIKYTPIRSVSH
jgi:hypothetical protein